MIFIFTLLHVKTLLPVLSALHCVPAPGLKFALVMILECHSSASTSYRTTQNTVFPYRLPPGNRSTRISYSIPVISVMLKLETWLKKRHCITGLILRKNVIVAENVLYFSI